MRILCLQLKRIGDAILTAPALQAMREAWPQAHLTLVLHGPSGGLAPGFAAADEVLVYAPGRPNVALWSRVFTENWDRCYDFTGTDRSALLARLSRAAHVAGYRKMVGKRAWRADGYTHWCDAPVRDLHTVDFHLALTGLPAPEATGLVIPAGLADGIRGLPTGEFIVVHPGTARAEKYWRPERWAEVITRLPLPVVLTGSSDRAEQAHLAAIRSALGSSETGLYDLSGRLSLLELASVIDRARLVLSVDSAAMHLAAMARRPQVALFGPTNPFHWRPRHPAARVVTAGGGSGSVAGPRQATAPMDALSTSVVLEAIDEVCDRHPAA